MGSQKKTKYSQAWLKSDFFGDIRLNDVQIQPKGIGSGVELSWVRNYTPSSKERGFFIAIVSGEWSLYSSHKGPSMFQNTPKDGKFPGIQNTNDIRGNRRWVLGLFKKTIKNIKSPKFDDFSQACYFGCPDEERPICIDEIEAWQPLGTTALDNERIYSISQKLHSKWFSGTYDARLWNSQNFTVYLALLVMLKKKTGRENISALRNLHWAMLLKQGFEFGDIVARRHLMAMGGMVVLGIATGPVGAVASWSYAGYGMYDSVSASASRNIRLEEMIHEFKRRGVRLRNPCSDGKGEAPVLYTGTA